MSEIVRSEWIEFSFTYFDEEFAVVKPNNRMISG